MLLTFISHAAWHYSCDSNLYHVQKMLAQLENYGFWSLTHLFQLFSTFRSWTNASRLVIFLGSFDECIEDDRRWFLDALKEDQSRGDIDYCVVITTGGSDEISKLLINESKTISLAKCPEPFLGYDIDEERVGAHGLNVALEHTIQKRPVLQNLKTAILRVLGDCRKVPRYGYVILQWLDNFGRGAPLANIAAALERLRPVAADTISKEIFGGLSNERRVWSLKVYQWVRHAKEPFTFKALGEALASSHDSEDSSTAILDFDYMNLEDELQRCFSGIIVIEGGEVKFSHDSFNQGIASNINDSDIEESSDAHGSIAKACLQYIMQHCTHQEFARFSVDNYGGDELKYPLCNSEQGLLEYAVQYWVHHYRLADVHRPIELALSFFHNKGLRNRWAEAAYLLSNPFTRIQRSYLSPLPLMACFGLEDLVSLQVAQDKKSDQSQQDILLAIIEAARNGHLSIFSHLLALVKAHEVTLKDAMAWASAAQNEDIVIEIWKELFFLDDFHWTQPLLSCAAINGSKYLVTAITKTDFNLNEMDDETGQTALHSAILWGHREIVEALSNSDIDLLVVDHRGMTPLELAIEMGDPEIVQILLDKGAKVDERTKNGHLITGRAAFLGHHMILDRLISAGAQFQVNSADNDTVEPIIRAAQIGRRECIRILLKHGANPCSESSDGSLLYQCCTRQDTVDICRLLLERGANPNETYSDKEMLLIGCLMRDNTETVGLLIDHGANINSIDPWEEGVGRTPLSFAASECALKTIEFLLDKGADVNYAPEGACPALFNAAFRDFNTARLELLLKHGAKLDWRRDDGWQALHAAYDAPDSVKVLLQHGADINAMCDSGTVTMMAARWGVKATLEVLVANQESMPDLDAKFTYDPDHDNYGTTAMHLAVTSGHYDCASFLLESGARFDDEMKDARFFIVNAPNDMSAEQTEACVKLIEQCVEHGTTANILDDEQNSVLHLVNRTTPVALVSIFISLGAPIDNTNTDGWTPLAVALKERNSSVAELLLSRGARADICNPKFGSLLHIVCDWQRYTFLSPTEICLILKRLVRRKADPNMPGPVPGGEPILYTAVKRIQLRVVNDMIARYLIEEVQVDINFGGPSKTYPVIAATSKSNHWLLNYFIRQGVDLEVSDDQDYGADIWVVSNDGQWSPLKLAYFAGMQERLEGILEPPEDNMERVLEDGSKQVWDTAFHRTPPAKHHLGIFCTSCLMLEKIEEQESVRTEEDEGLDSNDAADDDDEVENNEDDDDIDEEDEDDDVDEEPRRV
ncbi:hypothetical protein ACHAPY_011291 [Fusarium culmorum]